MLLRESPISSAFERAKLEGSSSCLERGLSTRLFEGAKREETSSC